MKTVHEELVHLVIRWQTAEVIFDQLKLIFRMMAIGGQLSWTIAANSKQELLKQLQIEMLKRHF